MAKVDKIQTKSGFKLLLIFNPFKSNFFISKFLNRRMIEFGSFREKFRMINIRSRMLHFSIRELGWNNINDFIRNFSVQTVSELNDSFNFCMNSVIFTNVYIFTRFPFEPSLPCNYVSWVYLFTTELFQSMILLSIITRVYDQQNLSCFVLMMLAFLKR